MPKCPSQPIPGYAEQRCLSCGVRFYRPEKSRQYQCCPCRKIRKRDDFEPLPAPHPNAMQSVDAAREYLAKDSIICLLCGLPFEVLGRHLLYAHSMTARTYKLTFRIPLSWPLSVAKVRQQRQKLLQERIARGELKTAADLERQRQIQATARRTTRPIWRSKHANLRPTFPADRVPALCSLCGADAGMRKRHVVNTHACRILCPTCKRERHKLSVTKYRERLKGKKG